MMRNKLRKYCVVMTLVASIVACAGVPAQAGDPYDIIQVVDGAYIGSVQSNTVVIESTDVPAPTDGGPVNTGDASGQETAALHSVTFLDWYGRELGKSEVYSGSGVAEPANPPQLDGQTFQFWFDEAGAQSTPYVFGSPVTQDIRLIPYYRTAAQTTQQSNTTGGDNYTVSSNNDTGMPQMPQMPQQAVAPMPQAETSDAAKKQATHFISEMVKALEPSEQTSGTVEAQRMAQSITQIETQPPMSNEDALALVDDMIQGSNILGATGDAQPGGDDQPLVIQQEVPPTNSPEPDPLALIEEMLSSQSISTEQPTSEEQPATSDPQTIIDALSTDDPAPAETETPPLPVTEAPVVTDAPSVNEPPVTEAPAVEQSAPPEQTSPAQQPEKPLTIEELLAIGQPVEQAPVAMSEQQAMDLVNEILTDMQVDTTIQGDKVEEIIDLIGEDRTDEAAELMEEIFQDPQVTQMPTEAPVDPTSPPWDATAQQAEPYVVATYQYDGELVVGTQVTVTANVYNLPEGQRLSYQWQNNKDGVFVDVPGATGQSHTFVADEYGLNGSSWRVNVMMEE